MLWHFYEFSKEQPQYFALMFVDRSVPSIRCVYERFPFAKEAKLTLIAQLQHCIDSGVLPAQRFGPGGVPPPHHGTARRGHDATVRSAQPR